MNYIDKISEYVQNNIGFDKEYVRLIILTILIYFIFAFLKFIIKHIYSRLPIEDKKKYFGNQNIKIFLNIICWFIIILIWGHEIQSIVTMITFVSAATTIAIKEIIVNFFAGLYIKSKKVFRVEDRIEIKGFKGDVINIGGLGFEMLEIADGNEYEQSTGKIIHVPNSYVFTEPVKNFTKAFKYIWDEIQINLELDADVKQTKKIIYNILKNNEILKEIPKKMENEVDDVTIEYRIYYNHLEPIIYTRIVKSHIELSLRYVVHPKKIRTVQNQINLRILEEYQKGNIKLYDGVVF